MQSKEELLSRLSDCVCDMEDDEVVDVVMILRRACWKVW